MWSKISHETKIVEVRNLLATVDSTLLNIHSQQSYIAAMCSTLKVKGRLTCTRDHPLPDLMLGDLSLVPSPLAFCVRARD